MLNYEKRLEALEHKVWMNMPPLVIFEDAELTDEQQKELEEARKTDRHILMIKFVGGK